MIVLLIVVLIIVHIVWMTTSRERLFSFRQCRTTTSAFSLLRSFWLRSWCCQNKINTRWRCYWHVFFLIHTRNRRTKWIIIVDRWALQMRTMGEQITRLLMMNSEMQFGTQTCLSLSLHSLLSIEVISFDWLVFPLSLVYNLVVWELFYLSPPH
jgi:hypothetical protein